MAPASDLNKLLTEDEIDSIRRPIDSALTFPASAYTSEEFYRLEIEKIYKRHWIAALFDFDIPNPGDIKPFDVCEIPLLAVRGSDGHVRVFHNICPYDGCMAVIDPAPACDEIVTPYHGWVYNLEGKLIRTPYWDGTKQGHLEALAGKEVDLIAANTEVFLNTVFVNLDSKPEPFDDYIAPIFRSLDEYDLEKCRVGLGKDGRPYAGPITVKANWKTYFENACLNVLHENFVHGLYSASPEVPRIKEDGVATYRNITDGKLMALGYDRRDFQETYPHVEAPHLGKTPDVEPVTETFGTLYPNFYICASSQFLEIGYLLPEGAATCSARVSYHFHPDVALNEDALEDREEVVNMFSGAALEDRRICEAVQRARKSPVYDQKFYAPFWDSMHHRLNQIILDDLEA